MFTGLLGENQLVTQVWTPIKYFFSYTSGQQSNFHLSHWAFLGRNIDVYFISKRNYEFM